MNNEKTNFYSKEELKNLYPIRKAKEYLKYHKPKGKEEPSLEYCIISDLLEIIDV